MEICNPKCKAIHLYKIINKITKIQKIKIINILIIKCLIKLIILKYHKKLISNNSNIIYLHLNYFIKFKINFIHYNKTYTTNKCNQVY